MATLAELTYDILNTARGGVLSDDETIGFLEVQYWIHNTRAMLIRQDINKGRTVSGNIIQILPCLDVDIVDASTCPCSLPVGCSILRTRNRIPKPIEVDNKDLIIKVSSIEISARPYTLINVARVPFIGNNKFAKLAPKAFYADGYIWLLNSSPVEKITVWGVFENPTMLKDYVDCSNATCYSDDDEYPISNWMIPALKQIIKDNDLKAILSTDTDTTSNAKNDKDNNQQSQ